MDISTWVRVSHVAECAALATEGSHEEARQVGQASDKPSLWRVVSVKDTVVDDVILKPISLIDVLLIEIKKSGLVSLKIENKVNFQVTTGYKMWGSEAATHLLWCL